MTLGYINTEDVKQFCNGPHNENAVSVNISDLPLAVDSSGKKFKVSAIANFDGDVKLRLKNTNEKDNQ